MPSETPTTFETDPNACICRTWGPRARDIDGHHGQCRVVREGAVVVGLTPSQVLARIGVPRPTVPTPR